MCKNTACYDATHTFEAKSIQVFLLFFKNMFLSVLLMFLCLSFATGFNIPFTVDVCLTKESHSSVK